MGEQARCKAHLPLDVEIRIGIIREQPVELGRISDIDHAKGIVVCGAEVQLALGSGQIGHGQPPRPVEQGLAQIRVQVFPARQVGKPARKIIAARVVHQARLPAQQAVDHGPHHVGVGEHPAEKGQDADHIGAGRSIRLARSDHGLAQEHPQGLGRVKRLPQRALVPIDAALLVKGQQAAEQVHIAVLVLHPARQVQNRVVLAVPVRVEPAVRVVEQQALAIGVEQIRIAARHLVEGRRVFKRKAPARQLPAAFAPNPARRAQMPFIDQHEIVVAKIRHGNALHSLLLCQLVQVDNFHRREQIGTRLTGKQPRPQPALSHLALVLHGQLLVWRDQYDVV